MAMVMVVNNPGHKSNSALDFGHKLPQVLPSESHTCSRVREDCKSFSEYKHPPGSD